MRILYPYNEILPKKKAHDVYIFHSCSSFAEQGWETVLLTGKGSETNSLFDYYQVPRSSELQLKTLPLIRKNNFLKISWNLPFFWQCQQEIQNQKPDVVLLSVRKQGAYHLKRKVKGVFYIYEVHELCCYPNAAFSLTKEFHQEKQMLQQADLITVTTSALKEILQEPPYSLQTPIEVVPLAVHTKPLPAPKEGPFTLFYVGQLYAGQGIPLLLSALAKTQAHLKIVGGNANEISRFRQQTEEKGIQSQVEFLGFLKPSQLSNSVESAHGFVAPFENTGRMPYVAHTKLLEYAHWGRPIIAPDLPLVREHLPKGALLFEPGNPESLANAINSLEEIHLRQKLQEEIETLSGCFSWETRASRFKKIWSCFL